MKNCICTEDYIWNPSTCIFEHDKYLGNNLVVACD